MKAKPKLQVLVASKLKQNEGLSFAGKELDFIQLRAAFALVIGARSMEAA